MKNLRFPVSNITEKMVKDHYTGNAAIGSRIQLYREKRGMSRNELAEHMSVSLQSVYRWESGERTPDVIALMEIAHLLGVNMNQLTGVEE